MLIPEPVIVGVDAGGTWLRAAVATLDGEVRRTACTPGGRLERGFPLVETASATLHELFGTDRIAAGAGSNAFGLADGWRQAGPAGAPFVTMSEATLACSPDHGRTVVLIAGTGSAAATIDGTTELNVSGAKGPAGDIGCGTWFDAVVAAAVRAAGEGSGPATQLTDLIAVAGQSATHLGIHAATAARAGDQVAAQLCRTAAEALWQLLLDQDLSCGQVITVGSVIAPDTTVRDELERLAAEHGVRFGEHRNDLTLTAAEWAKRLVV